MIVQYDSKDYIYLFYSGQVQHIVDSQQSQEQIDRLNRHVI